MAQEVKESQVELMDLMVQVQMLTNASKKSLTGLGYLSKEMDHIKNQLETLLGETKRGTKVFKHVKNSRSGGSILHVEDALGWFEENKGNEMQFKGGLTVGITEIDQNNKTRKATDKEGQERKKSMTARLTRDEIYQMYLAISSGQTEQFLGYAADIEEEVKMIQAYIGELASENKRVDIQTQLLLRNKEKALKKINKYGFQSYGRRRDKEHNKEFSVKLTVQCKDPDTVHVSIEERVGYKSETGATLPVKGAAQNFQVFKKFTMKEYELWVMNMYHYLETKSAVSMLKGKPLYTLMKQMENKKEGAGYPPYGARHEENAPAEEFYQQTARPAPPASGEGNRQSPVPHGEIPEQYENFLIQNIKSLKGKRMREVETSDIEKIVHVTENKPGYEQVNHAARMVLKHRLPHVS